MVLSSGGHGLARPHGDDGRGAVVEVAARKSAGPAPGDLVIILNGELAGVLEGARNPLTTAARKVDLTSSTSQMIDSDITSLIAILGTFGDQIRRRGGNQVQTVPLGKLDGKPVVLDAKAFKAADRAILSGIRAASGSLHAASEDIEFLRQQLQGVADAVTHSAPETIVNVGSAYQTAAKAVPGSVGARLYTQITTLTFALTLYIQSVATSIIQQNTDLRTSQENLALKFLADSVLDGKASLILSKLQALKTAGRQLNGAVDSLVRIANDFKSMLDPANPNSIASKIGGAPTGGGIGTPPPSGTTPPSGTSTTYDLDPDVGGTFIDGPFFGSTGHPASVTVAAGQSAADAVADAFTAFFSEEADKFREQLKPGETMAAGPRKVTVSNVTISATGTVSGSFLCQGGTGAESYKYQGSFRAIRLF